MVKAIPIEGIKIKSAFNSLFKEFLEKNLVDMLLVPQETAWGNTVGQTLVKDVDKLQRVNPLAPIMPVNSSTLVGALTKKQFEKRRIGVVLRPCEIRALIELTKFKQAVLDDVIIIGVDCLGVYSVKTYVQCRQEMKNGDLLTARFLEAAEAGELLSPHFVCRPACQICEFPVPEQVDLVIGTIGRERKDAIFLEARTSTGEEIIKELSLEEVQLPPGREKAVSRLIEKRKEIRDQVFKKTRAGINSVTDLLFQFSTCVLCHNCRRACPLCYCNECVFDTEIFRYEPRKYIEWTEKQGAIRMPKDVLLFHLTRMTHMITSCVGCGQCEDACPSDIPLGSIFPAVAEKVQKIFGYGPGKNVQEEPPLNIFKEEELTPR